MKENENEQRVRRAYDEYAQRILEQGYRYNSVYLATKALADWWLCNQVDLRGKSVINIGCAEPIDELHYAELVAHWTAIDVNENMLAAARQVARKILHPNLFSRLAFVPGDASCLPFPDNTFDVAVAFSTVEHIPDEEVRRRAFREMQRVTKVGGHVVVTVPNKYSIFYFAHHRNIRQGVSDYGFSTLYSVRELRKELIGAGLEIVRFGSEFRSMQLLPSIMPGLIRRLLSPLARLGERIGYLAVKRQ